MHEYNISSAAYYCAAQKIFGNRPSIGVAVIEHFEGIRNLFSLSEKELKSLSILVPECRRISQEILDSSYRELDGLIKRNIYFLCYDDSLFPTMLKDVNNYPIGIYIKTKDSLESIFQSREYIGVIGGKNPYSYGIKSCKAVIESLQKVKPNTGVITRMTSGIDSKMLEFSIDCRIPSIGVIPYGFSRSNQRENNMGSSFQNTDAIITDVPPDEKRSISTFQRRNRIVSALSRAIILIESNECNCEQIIEYANSYGKEIWAFPGPTDWNGYKYNNKIIRLNIAEMISDSDDLLAKIKRI